ncbi:ferredoxin-fold anticodon-binding domain-containing protein 1 [Ambystoma mexicanum]|uniref:ferredoxin-fold anticodon-binding domain-containing protein 1 n=1 Tax=Ambystoma mexicanum TaxID=8296 RepID=UPI0037E72F43
MKLGYRILLVGEGNFSFSVSLCAVAGSDRHITATCYESEAVITQQDLARSNVQHLREKGADVYFQVDCTKLKQSFGKLEKEFDQIIFNFPHCGKKAGVRKNRELLANFFCSCADVLSNNGEVHVALCRGQGGTPADHPIREWHNSWQVVAMAACGGLILSEVRPFGGDVYAGYKCTGYRSQEKPFYTDDALIHVFTHSLPLESPTAVGSKLEVGKVSFFVPGVFLDKISRHLLDIDSHHPVRIFNEQILRGLNNSFAVQKIDPSSPCLPADRFYSALSWTSRVSNSSLFWLSVAKEDICSEEEEKDRCPLALVERGSRYVCEVCDNNDQTDIPDQENTVGRFCLRPSLTVCIPDLCQRPDYEPGKVYALSGPVFRKCLISQWTMPVFHEAIFLYGLESGIEVYSTQILLDAITNTVESIIRSLPDEVQSNLENVSGESSMNGKHVSVIYREHLNKGEYSIHLVSSSIDHTGNKDLCVGTAALLPSGQLHSHMDMFLVMLHLDTLLMVALGMPDWRMLWTYDERFLSQFCHGQLRRIHSFSLFPPSFVHDVSFWVRDRELFDEVEFHTLVRRVSKECVTDIQLLDSFQDPVTGMLSLCYRLRYQSCDKALSEVQASTMQLQLRKELPMFLQVTLR